jgi:hypothetical protein
MKTVTAIDKYNSNMTCNVKVTPIALTDSEAQQHGYTHFARLTGGQIAKIGAKVDHPANVCESGVDRFGKVDRAEIYFHL